MSFTPYNAPLLGSFLGDTELTRYFSVRADVASMIRFETALANAEAACGLISAESAHAISTASLTFEPDMQLLGAGTARDGVAVPEFVKLLRAHVGEPHSRYAHFGATSQDLIDTSLTLRLKDVTRVLAARLEELDAQLVELDERFGSNKLVGRTRMQAAIPMRTGDRIRTWRRPLNDHGTRLEGMLPRLLQLQFGGAVGTLEMLGDEGANVTHRLARDLGLSAPEYPWHSDRSALADFAHWLTLVTGTLGKVGQDVALMVQNGIDEIAISGAGGSSAMSHKQNPIKAEALITLARFNAVLVSGMHQAMVHEQERSGTAWTLEWMVLPQMVIATGAATRTGVELLHNITRMGDVSA